MSGGIFLLALSVLRISSFAGNRSGVVLSNCALHLNAGMSLGHDVTDGNGIECGLAAPLDRVPTRSSEHEAERATSRRRGPRPRHSSVGSATGALPADASVDSPTICSIASCSSAWLPTAIAEPVPPAAAMA